MAKRRPQARAQRIERTSAISRPLFPKRTSAGPVSVARSVPVPESPIAPRRAPAAGPLSLQVSLPTARTTERQSTSAMSTVASS
jgi:hypothetical protein